jgi:hypothetical protein
MLNYKDSLSVKKNSTDFLAKLKEKFSERFELVTITVGSEVGNENPSFKENSSALELGFEKINTDYYNRNIGGIVFVSDGNFNEGQNPIYAASKIPLTPIFTLGVGDTTAKKDQILKIIDDVYAEINKANAVKLDPVKDKDKSLTDVIISSNDYNNKFSDNVYNTLKNLPYVSADDKTKNDLRSIFGEMIKDKKNKKFIISYINPPTDSKPDKLKEDLLNLIELFYINEVANTFKKYTIPKS